MKRPHCRTCNNRGVLDQGTYKHFSEFIKCPKCNGTGLEPPENYTIVFDDDYDEYRKVEK